MIRAALCARYSSHLQGAASLEDQFRICRDRAEQSGWTVTKRLINHARPTTSPRDTPPIGRSRSSVSPREGSPTGLKR